MPAQGSLGGAGGDDFGRSDVSGMTYDQAVANHVWQVPERYNIATDVCDKHPRDKLAMCFERFDGYQAQVTWGDLQDLAAQAAHALAVAGVGKGYRVAVVLPAS